MTNVVETVTDRDDRAMDGESERMPDGPSQVACAGHDVEGAVDGDRDDGQLQLVGQHEGAATEAAHVTRKSACSLGEDNQRHSVF